MGTLCFMEHRHRDHKIAYNKSLQWKLVLAIKAVSFLQAGEGIPGWDGFMNEHLVFLFKSTRRVMFSQCASSMCSR
jgi:hypothetical protein